MTIAQLEAVADTAKAAYLAARAGYTDLGVTGVTVSGGGTGYSSAPGAVGVEFAGGGGAGAYGEAVVTGSAVTAVNILTFGSGYGSVPSVTFVAAAGSGATGLAAVGSGAGAATYAAAAATYADALSQLGAAVSPADAAKAAAAAAAADALSALNTQQTNLITNPTAQPISGSTIAAAMNQQTALLEAVDKQQKLVSGGTPVNVGA